MANVNLDAGQALGTIVHWIEWALKTVGTIVLLALWCAALGSKVHIPTFSVPVMPFTDLMYAAIGWSFATGIASNFFRK